jgi:hypothetical protein
MLILRYGGRCVKFRSGIPLEVPTSIIAVSIAKARGSCTSWRSEPDRSSNRPWHSADPRLSSMSSLVPPHGNNWSRRSRSMERSRPNIIFRWDRRGRLGAPAVWSSLLPSLSVASVAEMLSEEGTTQGEAFYFVRIASPGRRETNKTV